MSKKKKDSEPIVKLYKPGEAVMKYVKGSWWVMLILAILTVILGVYAVFFPGATLEFFTALFGAMFIVGGLIGGVKSFIGKNHFSAAGLVMSLLALIIGILIVIYPLVFAGILIYIISIALLIKSILAFKYAFDAKKGDAKAWMIVSGVLGIIAAIFLFVYPMIGGLTILLLLGIYAIVFGIFSIIDLISTRRQFKKLTKK